MSTSSAAMSHRTQGLKPEVFILHPFHFIFCFFGKLGRRLLFCEHRDLSCCARPGDLCSGASPGMPGCYFCENQEPLISYFREITANPWEHVFFKYMSQKYQGSIQIDAPSKVIAMLPSMSSNGYQKQIIFTKKRFFPGRFAKTRL